MGRPINYYNSCLSILKKLHEKYPNMNLGRHLSSVLSDYGDPWGISDKELHFALEKYLIQMETYGGINISDDAEVARIIEEGKNLTSLFPEEDEEEEDF